MEEQLLWVATMVGTVACGISGSLMAAHFRWRLPHVPSAEK